MVKNTITGARRSTMQVATDCIGQLTDRSVTHWLSNGEDACEGRVSTVRQIGKGLRIRLDSGRVVTWKISASAARNVMSFLSHRFGWSMGDDVLIPVSR